MMEVNWDEIEQKYNHNSLQPVGYSTPSDENTTISNKILSPDAIFIVQDNERLQRPNAIDKVESSSTINQKYQTKEKPDGA